jgi:c-di-GMP-binding flagellar brake protein YcgR
MDVENRQFRRVFVGPEFTVSFVLDGRSYSRIGLANISEGGCLALIPGGASKGFTLGAELEELTLHHELMPHQPVEARVAYAFGAGELDIVGVGIQFLAMKQGLRQSLRDFVDAIPESL